MMRTAACCGARRSTTTAHSRSRHAVRRVLRARRQPARPRPSAADAGGDARRRHSAVPAAAVSAGRSRSPATSCGSSSAAAEPLEVGIPDPEEEPGRPRTASATAASARSNRTDPVFIGLQKTRLFDPTLNFMGTNDHAGRLSRRAAARPATSSTPTTARRCIRRPYAKSGNQGLTPDDRPDDPEERVGPPDQARVHHARFRPASAWSATCTRAPTW